MANSFSFSPHQPLPSANVVGNASKANLYELTMPATSMVQHGPINNIPVGTGDGTRSGNYRITHVRLVGLFWSETCADDSTPHVPYVNIRLIVNHTAVKGSVTDCTPALKLTGTNFVTAAPSGVGHLKVDREWLVPLVFPVSRQTTAGDALSTATTYTTGFTGEKTFSAPPIQCDSLGDGANDVTRHVYLLIAATTAIRYTLDACVYYDVTS